MTEKLRLGINIDHVATIRNARGGSHPDPIRAANLALKAGADSITAHLREDRRHISDLDIERINNEVALPLNLEIAATHEMLEIAIATKPYSTCIVPENREEKTTEGGLDVLGSIKFLDSFVDELSLNKIRVSLFVDPEIEQIEAAKHIGVPVVELHVGAFCDSDNKYDLDKEYMKILKAVDKANELGLECHAGHGINYETLPKIASIKSIVELNIGHFVIGESIYSGLFQVITKMQSIIKNVR